MEKTLQQLRRKYTLSTTILSGVILLVLFGAFFGMIVVSMNLTVNYTLDEMLENPLSGVPVRDEMGRRCFAFTYNDGADEVVALFSYSREFNSYGTQKEKIAVAAMQTVEGDFESDGMLFYVRTATLGNGERLYAVVDITSDARSVASIGMLTAVVYIAAVAVSALASYLFSSRALAPVGEAFRKQRDLIANASHELKTPLTVIATNLSVMKSEPDSTIAENAKWMDAIESQIQRMDGLIVNMLQLSKMEHGAVAMSEVNLSEITEGACLLFDAVCFEKNIAFMPHIQPDVRITGEKDSLERLVAGLLDNATKYCGAEGKIGLSLTASGKKAKLSVANTGEVVSEEDAKHIFDRFYRSDGARANGSGNSFGLGLSIAQATVLAHGGTIKCRGIPDKGTVFEIEFPLLKQEKKKKRPTVAEPAAERRTADRETAQLTDGAGTQLPDGKDAPNDGARAQLPDGSGATPSDGDKRGALSALPSPAVTPADDGATHDET